MSTTVESSRTKKSGLPIPGFAQVQRLGKSLVLPIALLPAAGMSARHIVLVATGTRKAEAVHQMVEGPVSARWPATILQHHPHVTVLLDAAASRLRLADYYRETDRAKPAWQGL